MKNVSRWFTLVSAVAVSIVAAGCGSESMSGPSAVVSGSSTGEQDVMASTKAAGLANTASELELVGYVKSAAPNFTVAGRRVVVTKATEIRRNKAHVAFGSIKVGEHVKVEGVLRSDGKVQAREIKVAYKGGTQNTIPGDSPGHHHGGNDDGPNHDSGDDNGGGNDDGPNHDGGDDNGDDGAGHN